jgi:hypothetical protein
MHEAAHEAAHQWRVRSYFLVMLLVFAPQLHAVVRALVEICQSEERAEEAEARNRALTITGSERVYDMDDMVERWVSDANMEADFRFDEAGLRALEGGLSIPTVVRLGDRSGHWYKDVTRTEVLLITLQRLHRCTTCRELGNTYGLQMSVVGMVVNYGLAFIDDAVKVGLSDIRRWVHYMPGWCEAVERKTNGVFTNVYGFIDVVIQRVCKISGVIVQNGQLDPQRYFYCGYKGFHALKFLGVESPCGVCINFYGPGMGSVSDSTMMHDSAVLADLNEIARFYNYQFGLCGDPAHPQSPVMHKPFMTGGRVTIQQRMYNHLGARMRVTVEWKFGDLQQYWRCLTEWKQLRILAMPVPRHMRVGMFLTNCANCHYPNRTEKYFECAPPTLDEYLAIILQPYQANLQAYHFY